MWADHVRAPHRRTGVLVVCAALVVASAGGATAAATAGTGAAASAKPIAGALTAVSCRSRTFCMAAGYRDRSSGNPAPLLMRWDGSAWNKIALPVPTGLTGAQFAGISCPSSRYCIAVGSGYASATNFVPISARWDGNKVHYLPQPTGTADPIREYLAVDCAKLSFCMAVGRSIPEGGRIRPLADVWNGTAWHESTVARPKGADTAEFLAVSCPSTNHCIATGDVVIDMVTKRGDGEWRRGPKKHWTVSATLGGYLVGADCPDTKHCYAVGYRYDNGVLRPIAQTVDGSTTMSNPGLRTGAATEGLNGLSCPAIDACLAVGDWTRTNDPGDSHFDARRWALNWRSALARGDPAGAQQTYPQAVSCPSKGFCTFVGSFLNSDGDREVFSDMPFKPFG
jgi:hypothetical protein